MAPYGGGGWYTSAACRGPVVQVLIPLAVVRVVWHERSGVVGGRAQQAAPRRNSGF
jgi:hypothetical protein